MRYIDIGEKMRLPIQFALIYAWLVSLNGTSSFYSVYILCAFLALVAGIALKEKSISLLRREKSWLLICSIFFSLMVILGNIPLYFHADSLQPKLHFWIALFAGTYIAWEILVFLTEQASVAKENTNYKTRIDKFPSVVFIFSFCVISAIYCFYFFVVAYPGVYSADSISTFSQILSGNYNNTMPFWHTITVGLVVKPIYALSGNLNTAAACFICLQIFFLVACMSYSIATMYQADVKPIFLFLAALVYTLAPYNIVYSVTLWKDVLFGAALLLMVTAMYRILSGMPGKSNYILFSVGALGGCLWRTNGWYTFAIAALFMLLILRKEPMFYRFMILMLGICVLAWILLNPVLTLLNVESTDLIEAFAVPFQQFARYFAEDGWMDDVERDLLGMAFDLDKVKELYEPYCVDPIKFQAFRRENLNYIQDNLSEYIKLYLRFFQRRPDIFLEAWADVTKGFWCGGFSDPMYDMGVVANELGLMQSSGDSKLALKLIGFCDFLRYNTLLEPLYAIGLHVWAIFACFIINMIQNKKLCLLSIPFMIISIGLMFGSPVVAEFRYGYPMVLAAPFLLAVTIFRHQSPSLSAEGK